jgi:adenylate kinase family enzyme
LSERRILASHGRLVAVLGPPGAGKSTVCRKLAKALRAETVSPGQELRKMAARDGAAGNEAQQIIRAAAPVPDGMLWSMLTRHRSKWVILDAVPRNFGQLTLISDFAKANFYEIVGVHLILPRQIALDRLTKRRTSAECEQSARGENAHCGCGEQSHQRLDDILPETLAARFDRYEQEVVPTAHELAAQFRCQDFDASRDLSDLMTSVMSWLR